MIYRYLGNKHVILEPLVRVTEAYCEPGDRVVDVFSGSLAVSLAFKHAGYRVTSNDINLFSSVLADAYLLPDGPPPVELESIIPRRAKVLRKQAEARIVLVESQEDVKIIHDCDWWTPLTNLVALQLHLDSLDERSIPKRFRRSDFFDTYCEDGANAAFVSSRGSVGRRRFFTPGNARRIDLILGQLRAWRFSEALDPNAYAVLLATILRAVEMVANTQGTFHDFPRASWDSRAFKRLRLQVPSWKHWLVSAGDHCHGREQDSLDYIGSVPAHRLIYIDPPYNFRQYTAYYFLLNVISRYPELEDPADYFRQVKYVRGQNPSDDFTSSFCKPREFLPAMETLIDRANAEVVVLSYFTGKNHWSNFDSGPSDAGRRLLTELLSGSMFEPGSVEIFEVPRTNYASYGGFKARTVDELLIVARKRSEGTSEPTRSSHPRVPSVA